MKKFLVAAALVGTALSAQAADLSVKAPYAKAPILQVYNWTGFYIGVNAGIGLGRDTSTLNVPGTAFESVNLGPLGGIGGGQLGYNWQFGQWLLGLETDLQAAGLRDSQTCILGCIPGASANINQRLDWFGTARARVGLVTGSMVSYVTGGFAYGGVKTGIAAIEGPAAGTFSNSQTRTGWTLGSGVEASLGGNWTGKIEYLYVDLGSQTTAFVLGGVPQSLNSKVRENIFRAGLNYRIGGNAGAEPLANWSGFYLGGNAGSGIARNRSSYTSLVAPAGPTTNAEQFNLVPDGYNGGLQAGYNWQAANWVLGVETDIQGSWQRDNKACLSFCNAAGAAFIDQKIQWFGTVRGRLGYAVGSSLFYATGGYAYGQVRTNILDTTTLVAANVNLTHTKGGWTAGAGLETPFELFGLFGRNWTSKTEYLYVDLGSTTDVFSAGGANHAFTTRVQEHVFRTGLNYHFNAPLIAKY